MNATPGQKGYVNADALVSTEWLAAHLNAPDVRVVDGSWHLPPENRDPNRDLSLERLDGRDGKRPAHLGEAAHVGSSLAGAARGWEFRAVYEALIDAVTAVSGSGPAYVFLLTECLAEAGIKAGLDAALARRLARATVSGSGELLHQSDLDPATLRQNVTSPGGTTAAALAVLMADDGLQPLMTRAVAAAARRGQELAG